MNYTIDTTFLVSLFVLPSLFGLTLIGEGVGKIMNYDDHGWIGLIVGSVFFGVIILAYCLLSSNGIN
ncbi:hypothetical protein KBD75_00010 [Candidatus Woesebacteria bacterium]|nr:hypothetical protein [Candidatus Woesebacteria bacterium]